MGKLLDSDAVIAMLRQEAKEWASAGAAEISLVYKSAAEDVEKMANEQSSVVDCGINKKEARE